MLRHVAFECCVKLHLSVARLGNLNLLFEHVVLMLLGLAVRFSQNRKGTKGRLTGGWRSETDDLELPNEVT